MYVFLLLTIIFAIREKVVFIAFAVGFGLACVGLAFTCWLRAKLNRKYKEQLLEKEKLKIENKKKNKITKVDKQK
jgi:disulfide oxidoreductase YuzD